LKGFAEANEEEKMRADAISVLPNKRLVMAVDSMVNLQGFWITGLLLGLSGMSYVKLRALWQLKSVQTLDA